jgi:hypothetical protein
MSCVRRGLAFVDRAGTKTKQTSHLWNVWVGDGNERRRVAAIEAERSRERIGAITTETMPRMRFS